MKGGRRPNFKCLPHFDFISTGWQCSEDEFREVDSAAVELWEVAGAAKSEEGFALKVCSLILINSRKPRTRFRLGRSRTDGEGRPFLRETVLARFALG